MKLLFTSALWVFIWNISYALNCQPSTYPPDPGSGCCGRAVSGATRRDGASVEINEYPWIGLVEFKKRNRIIIPCSATLISARYALSTAQWSKSTRWGTPINVRLGEYDTSNEGRDCVEVKPGQQSCTDGAIRIPIEKTFSHPDLVHNDISLIKLANTAPYTEFIRPICLPTLDVTIQHPRRFYMTIAGWGAVNATESYNSIFLRKVLIPYVDLNMCRSKYNASNYRLRLFDTQICAGSKNRDACKGDAGGPMMYRNGNTTEVAGLVSTGPRSCGTGLPGVYTKVFAYKEWINKTIEEEEKSEATTKPKVDSDIIVFRDD